MTQEKIAKLFRVQRPAITKHLKNIFESGELQEISVSSILEHTADYEKNKQKSQIIIYKAYDGQTKIEVRFENETVWLTQNALAELFQTTKQNIGQHIKNITEEG